MAHRMDRMEGRTLPPALGFAAGGVENGADRPAGLVAIGEEAVTLPRFSIEGPRAPILPGPLESRGQEPGTALEGPRRVKWRRGGSLSFYPGRRTALEGPRRVKWRGSPTESRRNWSNEARDSLSIPLRRVKPGGSPLGGPGVRPLRTNETGQRRRAAAQGGTRVVWARACVCARALERARAWCVLVRVGALPHLVPGEACVGVCVWGGWCERARTHAHACKRVHTHAHARACARTRTHAQAHAREHPTSSDPPIRQHSSSMRVN